ncbi:MAG: ribosome maturation factor RimM [Bacteroides sp.]|nr:ribosome maturation factor RimM [Ruminococcus flavefaciens]MCM1554737.1 ribosome maturation factor RimM [Bacteroides sp.]
MVVDKDSCYFLGKIVRTSGLKGEVFAFFDVDNLSDYQDLDSVFVEIKGKLVPYFIESVQIRHNGVVLRFEETDLEKAQAMVGYTLYLPLDTLPPLTGNKFYYHEVKGFEVVDKEHGSLGHLREVMDNAAQAVLCVEHPSGKEVMIPLVDEFLQSLDRENKVMHVQAPAGLVEFYLGL